MCNIFPTDYLEDLENTTSVLKDNNWTYVTQKNAHCLIEEFCKKNNLDPTKNHSNVVDLMIRNCYSFIQIDKKDLNEIFEEIALSTIKLKS